MTTLASSVEATSTGPAIHGLAGEPAARKAATAGGGHKLRTRLSKGEKRNRKRMAEVGVVYDATPVVRVPEQIITRSGDDRPVTSVTGPVARGTWLTASVEHDTTSVITAVFDEAERRDPGHRRDWLALVDGNAHQIDVIRAQAQRRAVKVTIVLDFVHVLEYLWKAAWCFYQEGDQAAERWVADHARRVLAGRAGIVAAAIRRKATCRGLRPAQRTNADTTANYLLGNRSYLDYARALEQGWPIATGVIEGACRHLVKDRMDITGARWGLAGAEAVLQLRALTSNGDFDEYWDFHLQQEHRRVHQTARSPRRTRLQLAA
ncbi:MAG: ISKra4 family transposase [Umezawaea sp.]